MYIFFEINNVKGVFYGENIEELIAKVYRAYRLALKCRC